MFTPKNWPDTLSEFVISDVVISDLFYFTMIIVHKIDEHQEEDERMLGQEEEKVNH